MLMSTEEFTGPILGPMCPRFWRRPPQFVLKSVWLIWWALLVSSQLLQPRFHRPPALQVQGLQAGFQRV